MPYFNDKTGTTWTNYGTWYIPQSYIWDDNLKHKISIFKTVEQKVSTPINPCYKDANEFPGDKTIINYIKSVNLTYKQMFCHELCCIFKQILVTVLIPVWEMSLRIAKKLILIALLTIQKILENKIHIMKNVINIVH